MAFFNKYPYTDFHELNADWVISQITEMGSTVEELETLVNSYETRVATLETKMTTAEGNIASLQAAATNAANRIAALEGADIQDTAVLSDMTGVSAGADSVEIGFRKDTFTDGNRIGTESDAATIPAATTSAAGVMTPEDKEKLMAYHLDNDDHATFSNPVAGPSPVGNNDYTTKAYVDNLAISGQAEPSKGTAIATADWTGGAADPSDMTSMNLIYRSYGSIRSYYLNGRITDWSAVSYHGNLLRGSVASAAIPAVAHDAFGCGQAAVSTGSDFTKVYPLNFRIAASGQVDIQIMAPGGIPAKSGDEDFMYVELQCVFIDV